MQINAPRGTQDILPSESWKWRFLERTLLETAALYGYGEIRTPTFEDIDLFCRGVGDTTDVVQKEMFEVKAQKGSDLFALRPEGTAGVVRAALQNGLLNDALPFKACYILSCFRHERPQAGRLREFHQFGCECFGSPAPAADVEMIGLIDHIIGLFGIRGLELNLNSIGCPDCRRVYYDALRGYFDGRRGELCPTCLERMEKNPMRILDCKNPDCQKITAGAPVMLDYLCAGCAAHFAEVKAGLERLGISFSLNPKIVRGLDYYTRTVFEFVSSEIGAQGSVFAGGRYDGLVEQLGGKPTPALGFGMGLERLLLVLEAQEVELPKPGPCDIYIAGVGEAALQKAASITAALRREGFTAECDLMGRSVKAQMKYAGKRGALASMVIGDSELAAGKAMLKDMVTGEQKGIELEGGLVNLLYDAMLAREADALAGQLGGDAFQKIMQMGPQTNDD